MIYRASLVVDSLFHISKNNDFNAVVRKNVSTKDSCYIMLCKRMVRASQ